MRAPPETKEPAALGATGSRGIVEAGASKKDTTTAKTPSRQADWRTRNPIAAWAHKATESALRRGLLARPDKCDDCGKVGAVDAHHDPKRYTEPLHIEAWVCRGCHNQRHKRLRREKAGDR